MHSLKALTLLNIFTVKSNNVHVELAIMESKPAPVCPNQKDGKGQCPVTE
jgi:hypothetical protein